MQLKNNAFFSLLEKMSPRPATAAHRWFVMAGTPTTSTTLPPSISIRQPPTCLNVVDPSHHPNNLFSYQPRSSSRYHRELISNSLPPHPFRLAFQRPDRRLTCLSQYFAHTSSNHLNTLLSIYYPPPPLLKSSPPSSRIHSVSPNPGIALL